MAREVDIKRNKRTNFALRLEFLRQTIKRLLSHKINYLLGFGACFIVVLIVSLLMTIISNSPVVFLRLAELSAGEIDIKVESASDSQHLNYTLISQRLESASEDFKYSTFRTELEISVISHSECSRNISAYDNSWKYEGLSSAQRCKYYPTNCFYEYCLGSRFSSTLFLINSEKEKNINLGREWKLEKLTEPGTAYIRKSLAKALNVVIGDLIYIDLNAFDLVGENIWKSYSTNNSGYERQNVPFNRVFLPVKISNIFSDVSGKFSTSVDNAIIMEFDYFFSYVLQFSNPYLIEDNNTYSILKDLILNEYSKIIIINLPKPRIDAYINSDFDNIQDKVIQFSSNVIYNIGFNELNTDLPVLTKLAETKFFGLFLGLILNIVIFIL
jgi:hypothetical protein